jgi:hypothetical protein
VAQTLDVIAEDSTNVLARGPLARATLPIAAALAQGSPPVFIKGGLAVTVATVEMRRGP